MKLGSCSTAKWPNAQSRMRFSQYSGQILVPSRDTAWVLQNLLLQDKQSLTNQRLDDFPASSIRYNSTNFYRTKSNHSKTLTIGQTAQERFNNIVQLLISKYHFAEIQGLKERYQITSSKWHRISITTSKRQKIWRHLLLLKFKSPIILIS